MAVATAWVEVAVVCSVMGLTAAAMVIAPAVFVIVMAVPAVRVARVNPDPFPMSI